MKLLCYLLRPFAKLASGIRGLVLEVKRPESLLVVMFGIFVLVFALGTAAIAELHTAIVSKVAP